MRIGVFGGTFDPPHLGHLILAAEAHAQLHLDRLLWVLTPDPPHKQGQSVTPLAQRLGLVQAAIADNPAFELSRVDIDRPGPHYAVDTARILGRMYPTARLVYLMGGDSLRDLPTWYQPAEFLAACHTLGVVRRPGDAVSLTAIAARLPEIEAKIRFVEAPLLQIAASDIRRRIAEGRPYRYFLPAAVRQIIEQEKLYAQASQT